MLASGQSRRTALLAAIWLGVATVAGVLLMGLLHSEVGYALPISAGVTLYVAATDLVPEVNREPDTRMALLVFLGVALDAAAGQAISRMNSGAARGELEQPAAESVRAPPGYASRPAGKIPAKQPVLQESAAVVECQVIPNGGLNSARENPSELIRKRSRNCFATIFQNAAEYAALRIVTIHAIHATCSGFFEIFHKSRGFPQ